MKIDIDYFDGSAMRKMEDYIEPAKKQKEDIRALHYF